MNTKNILLVLACAGALQLAAQGVNGPWYTILNNTPGEREYRFEGLDRLLNIWFVQQAEGGHHIRLCNGKTSPVNLNVRDGVMVFRYPDAIDTLRHSRPYRGNMRDAVYALTAEQWDNFRDRRLLSVTFVEGKGTLVREVTKAEADVLRDIARWVDLGPGE